ncbi:MAG TPA: carboxypeptidase regulatory-like domain-containing protein, partial [Terriglobia bacterium]|nr:carboxypeptidase regulatory-like domain-containing protein [Terriglobia bacterium]
GAAFAQSDRGTITGTVLDEAKAVVPGATVTAKHTETGTISKTITTATGNYTLPSLPVGVYEVTVELAGFSKATQPRVQVQLAQAVRLDVTLKVGANTETITVTDEAPLLKTENAEQATNISGDLFNSLPLNFGGGGGQTGNIRGWLSFIQLAPGVSGNDHRSAINGSPPGNFKIYLEGQDVTSTNDTVWTSTVAAASVETIGEFSLQTSNFAAEFGQVLGGVFNFTTKSGTNELHGSAYEYFTNEALDAYRPFSATGTPRARPISRKHDYGFTVGGPVVLPKLYNGRNRTFFFFNLEKFRVKTRSAATLATLPTAAYRRGDFSAALTGRQLGTDPLGRPIMENAIYDPRSTRTVNGQVVRDAFPNNVIPSELLDSVALKVQGLMPNPDNSELLNNWDPRTQNFRYQTIPSVKIDHNFSPNSRFSGYWSVQDTDQITGADGLPIPITGRRDQKIYGHTIRLNLDQTIRPTFLVHLGAGYVRFHNPDSAPDDVLNYDAVTGIGFTGASSDPSGFPRITGAGGNLANNRGGMGFNMGPTQANKFWNDKLTAVASASWVRNNHTYKFGGEFKQEVWSDVNVTFMQGMVAFSEAQTGLPYLQNTTVGGGTIGQKYAGFLMGLVNNATVSARRDPQWRKQAWSFYAQDNWKIRRNLTLDYGLRWDYAGQGHEIYYRTSQVGINTPNPSAGGLPGGFVYEGYGQGRCNCSFTQTYPYAFGPRLGLAYQWKDKTVFRAGWGLSFSGLPNWWYVTGGSNQLGLGFNSVDFSNPAFGEAALRLQNGLQYNRADLYTATLDPGIRPSPGQLNVPPAWGGQINDRNGGRPGRVNQWNISVQRELGKNLSLEVAYVGNRGVWMEANNLVRANAINPARLQALGLNLNNPDDRALLTSRIDSPLAASRGFTRPYAGYPGGASVAQTLRPFPQFQDDLAVRWAPLGKTWYDALQVKFTKRYSHGLDMTAAFTWQKEQALGSGSTGNTAGGSGAGGATINNVFNYEAQKGLAATSQPLVFVTGLNYLTPRYGPNRLVQTILGNWTVGGMLRYASGALLPVPASNNNLNSLIYQSTRMNRVSGQPLFAKDPGCKCIDPKKDFVLNRDAWVDAAPGQFGVSAGYYNDYRWQRQVTENVSLGRVFPIREKMAFEVRAEFFNIFNRLTLRMPTDFNNNPQATRTFNSFGEPSGGFGYINPTAAPAFNTSNNTYPRNGQIVLRFQF